MNMYYVYTTLYETFLVVDDYTGTVESEHHTAQEANERCKELNDEIESDIEKSNLGFQMEKLQRMNDSVSGK